MGGVEATAAIMVLVGFLGGVMAGVVLIVSVASRREDRHYSLTGEAPDHTCESARRLTGFGVRGGGLFPSRGRPDARDPRDANGQEADR